MIGCFAMAMKGNRATALLAAGDGYEYRRMSNS